jgi:hypothetical protein
VTDEESKLSEAEIARLRALVTERGEGPIAIAAAVHRLTVTRALAGLPVRRGSLFLMRKLLEANP